MKDEHRHFIIQKPYAMLSQFVRTESNRRNKKLLGQLADFPEGTMAVGRLDEKSVGLLLLTTDGHVSQDVRSAKVEKEYYVEVDGEIGDEAIELMKTGVEIGFEGKKYLTKPCKAKKIEDPGFDMSSIRIRDARHGPTSWVSVILREGKYRQVRKMTAAVGFPTLRLVRVRLGELKIEDYKPGHVEEIGRDVLVEMGLVERWNGASADL